MNEDRLLRELGHLAKEEEGAEKARLDERWDRLAAGTLTTEEEAELLALAETSSEAREAWEAFRPLGPEFQARVVEKIAAELPKKRRGRILQFPAVRIGGWVTAAAAVAACLLVLLRSPAAAPALPVYTAELSGGVQTIRGEAAPTSGPQVFGPGSWLTLIVRPQQTVSGPVEARAFLAQGAEIVSWQPGIEIENGGVRLQGEPAREVRPGDWRLWVVVGRTGKLPSGSELQDALRAGPTRHADWQAVYADLRVEDRPSP